MTSIVRTNICICVYVAFIFITSYVTGIPMSNNNAPILVTGAAGNVGSVGRGVVKLLRERDLPVRALVLRLDERSQALREETGAEFVVADLTNGTDLVRALRGCKRMYFGMIVSPLYLQATAIAARLVASNLYRNKSYFAIRKKTAFIISLVLEQHNQ